MQNSPLVSVIIPVYNKELCIRETLNSVLSQHYTNFEIIIVDDGSSDRSKNIIEEFVARDNRCRYFYKKNGGVSSARNYGIDLASGEYISFLDADDEYNENFLKEMVASAADVDFAFCAHYISYNSGQVLKKSRMKFATKDFLHDYLLNKTTPNTNSWLIKRDLLLVNRIRFDESMSWGEDMLFFATTAIYAKNYKAAPGYYTKYNMYNENSLTNSFDCLSKIESDSIWLDSLCGVIKEVITPPDDEKYLMAINGYRRPAGIVYNLYAALESIPVDDVRVIFIKYRKNISRIYFLSGLRSLKLFLYYALLRLKIWL